MDPTAVTRMDDRLDAIETALRAALPTHVIKRSLKHFTAHAEGEIEQGVVMMVAGGEKDYRRDPGMIAKEGTQRLLLVAHLKAAETDEPTQVEAAELDLAEEIKTFVRSGVSGMTIYLESIEHSRQLDFPYGWLVVYLDVGPPNSGVF